MQPALEALLRKRKDRSIAIILNMKERECDRHLPPAAQKLLRKVILDQFNEFHALVMDLADSLDTGDVVLNEDYLEKIDHMYDTITSWQVDGPVVPRPQRLTAPAPTG